MYRIAILDDEEVFCRDMARSATALFEQRGVPCEIRTFNSSDDLLSAVRPGAFDLYFIDVLLGDGQEDGITTAKRLRRIDQMASMVFVTVSLVHAPEGYGLDASGYLLKPLDSEKLSAVVDRALARYRRQVVVLETPTRTVRFDAAEVAYFEVRNHTVTVRFLDGGEERVNDSLVHVIDQLPTGMFARSHRAFTVNVGAVRSVRRDGIVLQDGSEVPVGPTYYRKLRDALLRHAQRRHAKGRGRRLGVS